MRQKLIKNNYGQSILEYALIATIVGAAAIGMSTYVFRTIQATQQIIVDESSEDL